MLLDTSFRLAFFSNEAFRGNIYRQVGLLMDFETQNNKQHKCVFQRFLHPSHSHNIGRTSRWVWGRKIPSSQPTSSAHGSSGVITASNLLGSVLVWGQQITWDCYCPWDISSFPRAALSPTLSPEENPVWYWMKEWAVLTFPQISID